MARLVTLKPKVLQLKIYLFIYFNQSKWYFKITTIIVIDIRKEKSGIVSSLVKTLTIAV